ncbi:hypothetical protein [Streptomyces carpinensis]|uniref:Uncharacterized protein n=1 Tax=Streptomyces carpinensis TaxID=66369 RepID=A0ABV1VY99_9ACTN|nr:hypothetical protein [Streptomyces carpinensis]
MLIFLTPRQAHAKVRHGISAALSIPVDIEGDLLPHPPAVSGSRALRVQRVLGSLDLRNHSSEAGERSRRLDGVSELYRSLGMIDQRIARAVTQDRKGHAAANLVYHQTVIVVTALFPPEEGRCLADASVHTPAAGRCHPKLADHYRVDAAPRGRARRWSARWRQDTGSRSWIGGSTFAA